LRSTAPAPLKNAFIDCSQRYKGVRVESDATG
jgi:hypothetical protein